ncbi:MAG TPA: hypothetical protein VMJ11_26505 [Paraburkholderia sp.]|uniref:hypothetical protein n=1 Tax=Paraburkholderia sp. TaxID=1926495 RepID=UPI002D1C25BD|nr:hypothetical protein [Paraburkholderia sp.]HTR10141.1 hypothetical protein [Paraburkholderia sp.]
MKSVPDFADQWKYGPLRREDQSANSATMADLDRGIGARLSRAALYVAEAGNLGLQAEH